MRADLPAASTAAPASRTSRRTSTPARPVPILMYHGVEPEARPAFARFTVETRAFAWQMAWLARTGHTAITVDQLLAARTGGAPLPRRPVLLTFDDGFANVGEHAVPILRRHGFTAIFYLVAQLVGRPSRWLEREVGTQLPLMDWHMIHALQRDGFDFGSHTLSHPRLAQLPEAECRAELVRSRQMLEEGLGRPVVHLAYPFGSHDAHVTRLACEAGYRTACTTIEGRSRHESLLALHRIPIYGNESRLDFVSRVLSAQPFTTAVRLGKRRLNQRVRDAVQRIAPR